MSDVVKLVVLMSVLLGTIVTVTKYNSWYYDSKVLPFIENQSVINQKVNEKLNELQSTMNYVEFSLDVNNRLVEEVLMEQVQKKGDE